MKIPVNKKYPDGTQEIYALYGKMYSKSGLTKATDVIVSEVEHSSYKQLMYDWYPNYHQFLVINYQPFVPDKDNFTDFTVYYKKLYLRYNDGKTYPFDYKTLNEKRTDLI